MNITAAVFIEALVVGAILGAVTWLVLHILPFVDEKVAQAGGALVAIAYILLTIF